VTQFNIDSIVCHVGRPNNRHEKHGEEDILACDVPLRVMEPDDWSKVMACVWECERDKAGETLHSLDAMNIEGATFASDNALHTVNFRQSTKKLVTLIDAKVNKVKTAYGEDLGMTFRVQARVSPEQYATLLELWGEKYRIEITCTGEAEDDEGQDELELSTAGAE
jgi:hypothetical protein